MAGYQAPGLPFGPHSQFIKHRIDSLTVRGVYSGYRDPTGSRSYTDMQNMARVLEGTFRSVNNLLETLHHSEFFYFTAAVWRFISIGRFMPLLALLLLPLVLEISYCWDLCVCVCVCVQGCILGGAKGNLPQLESLRPPLESFSYILTSQHAISVV